MKANNLLNLRYIYERRDRILPRLGYHKRELSRVVHQRANVLGIPLTANDRHLKALRNIHRGQRAFVIGMGPSLRIGDLDRLQGEVTFACNKIYLAFDETDWRPTYYTVLDVLIAEDNRKAIQQLNLRKIFNSVVKPYFRDSQDIVWLRKLSNPIKNGESIFRFSRNALEGVYGGWTVIYTMLQLAFYIGIKEVYLVGIDFSFHTPKPTGEMCIHGEVLEHRGEVNHFHPEYRKPGEKWTMPKLDIQYKAFLCARKAFESHGRFIYNASRKTALDILPIVNFDDIVPAQPDARSHS